MKFALEHVHYVLNDNFEDAKALFLSPLMAIHYAHLVVLPRRASSRAPMRSGFARRSTRVALDEVRDVRFDGTCEDLFF